MAISARTFPGALGHRGLSIHDIGITLFISLDGVFGIMANVLVTYVILFIFFGAFLQKSGVGKFFIDWPLALAGTHHGRTGQGCGHGLGILRLCVRFGHCQHRVHGCLHHPAHEAGGLSSPCGRSH